jgi:hypothetical protein
MKRKKREHKNNRFSSFHNCYLRRSRHSYLLSADSSTDNSHTHTITDITVSGSSPCLRFFNDSVPIVYVPFTVAANQQMQLTIEAPKMPGGAGGWVDVYLYSGFWTKE